MSLLEKLNKRRAAQGSAGSLSPYLVQTVHVRTRQSTQARRSNGSFVVQAVASRNGATEIAEAGKRDMSQMGGATRAPSNV